MLPSSHRLRRSSDFASTIRRGSRARRGTLVVHHRGAGADAGEHPAAVGFVVSRAVGNSVVRHRVTRRLRHVVLDQLGGLPPGTTTVVRALPGSATADSATLAADFTAALAAADRALLRSRP